MISRLGIITRCICVRSLVGFVTLIRDPGHAYDFFPLASVKHFYTTSRTLAERDTFHRDTDGLPFGCCQHDLIIKLDRE